MLEQLQSNLCTIFEGRQVNCQVIGDVNSNVNKILTIITYQGGLFVSVKLSINNNDLKIEFVQTSQDLLLIDIVDVINFVNSRYIRNRERIFNNISPIIGQPLIRFQ
jgi:hypothetical protein